MPSITQQIKNVQDRINNFVSYDECGELTFIFQDMLKLIKSHHIVLQNEVKELQVFRNETFKLLDDKIKEMEKRVKQLGKKG